MKRMKISVVETPFASICGRLYLFKNMKTGNCVAVIEICSIPYYTKISAEYYDISAKEFGEVSSSSNQYLVKQAEDAIKHVYGE